MPCITARSSLLAAGLLAIVLVNCHGSAATSSALTRSGGSSGSADHNGGATTQQGDGGNGSVARAGNGNLVSTSGQPGGGGNVNGTGGANAASAGASPNNGTGGTASTTGGASSSGGMSNPTAGTSNNGGSTGRAGSTGTGTGGSGTGGTASVGGVFPLSRSANGRYLQTASGTPFLINSSSAWGLIAGLSLADAKNYIDKRAAQGFNVLITCLVVANDTIPPRTETWQSMTSAFTSPGDYSTPNPAYFSHADDVVSYAESKGVYLLLVPIYLGWYGGPNSGSWDTMQSDTNAHLAAYGTFVGNRYGTRKNVGWCLGGDQYAEFRSSTTAAREQALASALKAAAPNQFYTAHLDSSGDSVRFQESGMHSYDAPEYRTYQAQPWGLNGHYAFAEQSGTLVYTRDRDAHALTVGGSPVPHFHLDESYEGETNGTAVELRRRQHRAMCEGACGGAFNAGSTWYTNFNTTAGSTGQTQNVYWWQFWSAIPWSTLTPDANNSFVTAGRGTYGSNNYVSATASSTLLIAYLPDGAATTLTVAMSKFSKSMRARWWDPTSGTFTAISSSLANTGTQNFAQPGNNSSGNATDWLLILD